MFVGSLNELDSLATSQTERFTLSRPLKSTGMTSEQFADELLLSEKVAVVPGNVFGPSGEGHIRCSYASSLITCKNHFQESSVFTE